MATVVTHAVTSLDGGRSTSKAAGLVDEIAIDIAPVLHLRYRIRSSTSL